MDLVHLEMEQIILQEDSGVDSTPNMLLNTCLPGELFGFPTGQVATH